MNEFDRDFFTDMIERVINAYNCDETNRCEHCPYGFGYLDDCSDHSFWWCNNDKIEETAIKLLFILKEKI